MRIALLLVLVAGAVVAAGRAAVAEPTAFQLVFDGAHNAELLHQGTFTTSSPWCPSGSAVDISVDSGTDTARRRFSCVDGGEFIAELTPLPAEHGGSGSWRIVGGSGPLADLRGKGTFTSTRLAGNPQDPATITFRSVWDGATDLDTTGPAVRITGWSARKLPRPAGSFGVRLALALTDSGGPVSYTLQVVDPKRPARAFAYKLGRTTTGAATLTFRITVPKTIRVVRVEVDAEDAVGNQSAFAKAVRLR